MRTKLYVVVNVCIDTVCLGFPVRLYIIILRRFLRLHLLVEKRKTLVPIIDFIVFHNNVLSNFFGTYLYIIRIYNKNLQKNNKGRYTYIYTHQSTLHSVLLSRSNYTAAPHTCDHCTCIVYSFHVFVFRPVEY